MNCHEFEFYVPDLTRDRLIDAAIRECALGHAENCSQCAARLTEERALLVGIRSVIAEISEKETPARVETSLLAAFRTQTLAAATRATKPMPVRRNRFGWRTVAVAAAIVLMLSALLAVWLRPDTPQRQTGKEPNRPEKTMPAPATADDGNRDVVNVKDSSAPRRRKRRLVATNPDKAEFTTQFFPLMGSAEDLSTLENVRLVRVELPGSALSDVGLRVVPENRNTPVKADVVLGPDGSARAIRFVR